MVICWSESYETGLLGRVLQEDRSLGRILKERFFKGRKAYFAILAWWFLVQGEGVRSGHSKGQTAVPYEYIAYLLHIFLYSFKAMNGCEVLCNGRPTSHTDGQRKRRREHNE